MHWGYHPAGQHSKIVNNVNVRSMSDTEYIYIDREYRLNGPADTCNIIGCMDQHIPFPTSFPHILI